MHNGRIELILGPMFAGKSTELFRRIRRHEFAKRTCVVIKHKKDTRYSQDKAATHDGRERKAIQAEMLSGIDVGSAEVVGIDEGQFFPDIAEVVELWANHGKIVIVAALDGTFEKKPFGSVLKLVPLAESVEKLLAVCMCCHEKEASFTKRRESNSGSDVIFIGGAESYLAVCRGCHEK